MTLTGYPRCSKNFTLRDSGIGNVSFSRSEGEMNAMVPPGFSDRGTITGAEDAITAYQDSVKKLGVLYNWGETVTSREAWNGN